MSDIEKAFNFLHDSIPSWFTHLAEIEEKVMQMENEITRVPVTVSPPMRRKTGSIESIRESNMDAIPEEPTGWSSIHKTPCLASRKRKTTSVLSGQGSGPSKYRTRTLIIVQYDGQIQKAFETLVRNIGTGRNMLRKGKMAARMEAMAELAASDDDDEDEDDENGPVLSKIGYRPRGGLSSFRTSRARAAMQGSLRRGNGHTPPELFDTTDKALEQAQGLCERAAHQSLRDGDCRKELSGAKTYFSEVLETATQEAAKYSSKKPEAKEESKLQAMPSSFGVEPKSVSIPIADIQHIPAVAPITAPKAMDIEVDDNEEDDVEFVMPRIRLTSRV